MGTGLCSSSLSLPHLHTHLGWGNIVAIFIFLLSLSSPGTVSLLPSSLICILLAAELCYRCTGIRRLKNCKLFLSPRLLVYIPYDF
jgi:hypothetical protein